MACLKLAVETFSVNEGLLVIGGDTLFYEDFSLPNLVQEFEALLDKTASLVLAYDTDDIGASKCGILEVSSVWSISSLGC